MTTGRPPHDRSCAALRPRMEAFTDGELGLADANLVRAHLLHCHHCLAEVQSVTDINQALRALGTEPAPPDLWRRIATRLDEEQQAVSPALPSSGSGAHVPSRRVVIGGTASVVVAMMGSAYWLQLGNNSVVAASVNDFIVYRSRGWTVDHAAKDARSLTDWAQARVTFAVPSLREHFGAFEIGGVRLCWLLNRRLLGLTYASGEDRAVVYVMEAHGLSVPPADRTLSDGHRVAVQHVKGHGVAVWSESDLVFVLVAAERDFDRALVLAGHKAQGSLRPLINDSS